MGKIKYTMEINKCVCIKEYYCYSYKRDVYKDSNFYYQSFKVKFNPKKKKYKVVRPTQMGEWRYDIFNEQKEYLYEVNEYWFSEHFTDISNIREEKIKKLINEY